MMLIIFGSYNLAGGYIWPGSYILEMVVCSIISINAQFYIPYEWYIWQTLSLVIWEEKQIGGYLVQQISSFIVRIEIKQQLLAVILIWRLELNPPNCQIKIIAKCTTYMVAFVTINIAIVLICMCSLK